MEVFELDMIYLHIVYDTFNCYIVDFFHYFDNLDKIPSWGFLFTGTRGNFSSGWVQHALKTHAVLTCSSRIKSDVWVGFSIKPVSKYMIYAWATQGVETIAKKINCFIVFQMIFLSLLWLYFLCDGSGGILCFWCTRWGKGNIKV